MRQFEEHPTITYELNGKKFAVKNLFILVTLREILKHNNKFLMSYDLSSSERPDIVAEKVYGNSDLAWLVLLVNDIVDPTNEWVHSTTQFQKYLNTKYETAKELYSTAYTLKDGKVQDREAMGILNDGKSPFNTKLSKLDASATDIAKYQEITNAYAEDLLNESRGTIKLIRKEYLNEVLADISKKLGQ